MRKDMGTREGTKDIPKGMSICPVPSLSLRALRCPEFVSSLSSLNLGGGMKSLTPRPSRPCSYLFLQARRLHRGGSYE